MSATLEDLQARTATADNNRQVAIWLLICCALIFAMVVLGGTTRLTGSGLSMVEWEPLMGMVPPLSQDDWEGSFRIYQQFPEYQILNRHMTLGEYKNIFWFEYAHRMLGRIIGFVFFFPMAFFIIRKKVPQTLRPKLVTMFILGGLQGLLGWYMVKSGLVDNPHVSQYRLAAHLGFAFIIYAYIFWTALGLLFPKTHSGSPGKSLRAVAQFSVFLVVYVYTTVISGAFVAGLKAGLFFNTFPLMDGRLVPEGLLNLEPVWRNVFENIITVQFDHRLLAISLFSVILIFWYIARKKLTSVRSKIGLNLLLAAALLQVTLGISTLLMRVPVPLAAAHQAGALLLFTAALFVCHALRTEQNTQ